MKTSLEIIFQKPYQQRITLTSPTLIETTALDDYEGWQRQLDPTKPKQWRLTVLAPAVVKNLRANGLVKEADALASELKEKYPNTADKEP